MSSSKLLKHLRSFATNGHLVRVRRKKGWQDLDGSVVGLGKDWLLMSCEYDAGFYGFNAIRICDIRKIKDSANAKFVEAALASEGHWPLPRIHAADLSSTRALVESLCGVFSLVGIYTETSRRHALNVGTPTTTGSRALRLHEVTPAAVWGSTSTWNYRELSRIQVGDPYLDRLAKVAGPRS
jgi:hypothetical protein